MIIDYSIHRTDRVPTSFECWSAIIIVFMLGWIACATFNAGLDAYHCSFGVDDLSDWRRE